MKRKAIYRHPGTYSTYPHHGECSCGVKVLTGFYDGWPIMFDIPELSQLGELEALIRNHRTFHMVHPNVYIRHALSIERQPVPRDGAIHREHKCESSAVSVLAKRVYPVFAPVGAAPPF